MFKVEVAEYEGVKIFFHEDTGCFHCLVKNSELASGNFLDLKGRIDAELSNDFSSKLKGVCFVQRCEVLSYIRHPGLLSFRTWVATGKKRRSKLHCETSEGNLKRWFDINQLAPKNKEFYKILSQGIKVRKYIEKIDKDLSKIELDLNSSSKIGEVGEDKFSEYTSSQQNSQVESASVCMG